MPVPDFSPGEVLTAAAMDSIGLWLVKTQTVGTGVSSVTVTGAFSATYSHYKIVYTGGTISGAQALGIQLGPTSVPGYNTSYETALFYGTPAANAFAYAATDKFEWVGGGNTSFAHLSLELNGPFLSRFTRMSIGQYQSGIAMGNSQGVHSQANSYSAFTISGAGVTLTGGTIRVYGYRD